MSSVTPFGQKFVKIGEDLEFLKEKNICSKFYLFLFLLIIASSSRRRICIILDTSHEE